MSVLKSLWRTVLQTMKNLFVIFEHGCVINLVIFGWLCVYKIVGVCCIPKKIMCVVKSLWGAKMKEMWHLSVYVEICVNMMSWCENVLVSWWWWCGFGVVCASDPVNLFLWNFSIYPWTTTLAFFWLKGNWVIGDTHPHLNFSHSLPSPHFSPLTPSTCPNLFLPLPHTIIPINLASIPISGELPPLVTFLFVGNLSIRGKFHGIPPNFMIFMSSKR